MPKKYRVELSLVEYARGTQLDAQTVSEYEAESEAREGFQDKVKVTRDTGADERESRS
jgi:hypothetical protein